MNTYRRSALAAGVLLVIATAGGLIATAVVKPFLPDPVDLARIAADPTPLLAGVLVKLVAYAACPAIALAFYPALRRLDGALALGAVAFRLMEAAFYAAGAACLLILVSLSRMTVDGAIDPSAAQGVAALLLSGADRLGFAVAVPFFGIGALLYYLALFRWSLVPRWLSAWGGAGAVLAIVASALVTLQVIVPTAPAHIVLNVPIFLQEMVLAVWLIARGFTPAAVAAAQAPAALPATTPATAPAPVAAGAGAR